MSRTYTHIPRRVAELRGGPNRPGERAALIDHGWGCGTKYECDADLATLEGPDEHRYCTGLVAWKDDARIFSRYQGDKAWIGPGEKHRGLGSASRAKANGRLRRLTKSQGRGWDDEDFL